MSNLKMNENTISTLRHLISVKEDRVISLERRADYIRSLYKGMDEKHLVEAIHDVHEMEQEIEEHKAWCKKARTLIDSFYRPAFCVA